MTIIQDTSATVICYQRRESRRGPCAAIISHQLVAAFQTSKCGHAHTHTHTVTKDDRGIDNHKGGVTFYLVTSTALSLRIEGLLG